MNATIIKDELIGEIGVTEITITTFERYNAIDFDTREIMSIVENYVLEKHGIVADEVRIRDGVITIKF